MKINNTIMQYDERGGGGVHKRNIEFAARVS